MSRHEGKPRKFFVPTLTHCNRGIRMSSVPGM